MTTLEFLQKNYGPLMSMEALAKTLDRSKEGLRVGLCSNSDFSRSINSAKKKIGRRVYFKTEIIAEIIDSQDSL
ncbi:MAG: hypothetical protein ACRBEE_15675 [Arenicella sp.]